MSDKGGSDLDVFDGLAKKARPSVPVPSSGPRPAPPPPAPRQKTLLGLAAPVGLSGPPLGPLGRPNTPAPLTPVPSRPPAPPPNRASVPPPSRASTAPIPSGLPPIPPPNNRTFPPPPAPSKPPARTGGLSVPPMPGLPKLPSAAAPVDMDWDDEDEKTAVFEKSHEDAARALLKSAPAPAAGTPPPPSTRVGNAAALLSSSGGPAPSLPRPPSPPPPSAPIPSRLPSAPIPSRPPTPLGLPPSIQVPSMPVPTHAPPRASYPSVAPPSSGGRTALVVIAALLIVGLVGGLAMLLIQRPGNLVVTVAGPGNKALDSVQVLVDGTKKCESSPCRVTNLDSGTHMVKIVAAGYQQTADQAVKVQSGEDAVLNVTLAHASQGTGVKVTAEGSGLRLKVGDKDIGPLPQELKDMTPGDHVIRIEGSERYEPWEQKVTVEPEKLVNIDPKLKVIKGLATIKAGQNADGARVLLVSGNERRPIPSLPIKIDITTTKPYSLVASRNGYADFKQDIVFEDGQAEKTFVIDLNEIGAPPKVAGPLVIPQRGPDRPSMPQPVAEKPDKPAPAAGQGTLNINSIPVSNVILDGKPLGPTPKVGLKVSPGAHTVVFVHAEHGRKVRGVTVQPGQAATAAVRFP